MSAIGLAESKLWYIGLLLLIPWCAGEVPGARNTGGPHQANLETHIRDLHEIIGHLEVKVEDAVNKITERLTLMSTEIEEIKSSQNDVRVDIRTTTSLIDAKMEVQEMKLENTLEEVLELSRLSPTLDNVASSIRRIERNLSSLHDNYGEHNSAVRRSDERLEEAVGLLINQSANVQPDSSATCPVSGSTETLASAFHKVTPFLLGLDGSCFVGRPADVPGCCEITPSGERWLVFLRRKNGLLDFHKHWDKYREGFGQWDQEFWLGNRRLHQITSGRRYRLRVELMNWDGEVKFAEYSEFRVNPETDLFRLTVTGYQSNSTAGDGMRRNSGRRFSTTERDHDANRGNCATAKRGGWWYAGCGWSTPTGQYQGPAGSNGNGNTWYPAYKDWRAFKEMTYKIQPVDI